MDRVCHIFLFMKHPAESRGVKFLGDKDIHASSGFGSCSFKALCTLVVHISTQSVPSPFKSCRLTCVIAFVMTLSSHTRHVFICLHIHVVMWTDLGSGSEKKGHITSHVLRSMKEKWASGAFFHTSQPVFLSLPPSLNLSLPFPFTD